jgi:glycosyltransferase involved in cell wall biosynthesis
MRILLASDTPVNRPVSGSEQVLFQHARGLAQAGETVRALSRENRGGPPVRREVHGALETCYGADPKSLPRFLAALFTQAPGLYDGLAAEAPFDAAVCHHPFTYFALLATGRLRGLPVLHVFHSPAHAEYRLARKGKHPAATAPGAAARLLVERACVAKAGKVMTLSRYMANKVMRIYGAPREKIAVNPGGVDLTRFHPPDDRAGLKARLGHPPGSVHFLTVRNLEPRMGLDNLLLAMAELVSQGVKAHLTVGGTGPLAEDLAALAGSLRLGGSVRFTGYIPGEALADHYGAADYFVLPTRELEGFGLVTVESLACGTPVLGTPVGGTLEILSGFDSSFLFASPSPQDIARGMAGAMASRGAKSPEYFALRERCREHARARYSWERHTKELLRLLEEL